MFYMRLPKDIPVISRLGRTFGRVISVNLIKSIKESVNFKVVRHRLKCLVEMVVLPREIYKQTIVI